jgi:hypothetical protein
LIAPTVLRPKAREHHANPAAPMTSACPGRGEVVTGGLLVSGTDVTDMASTLRWMSFAD